MDNDTGAAFGRMADGMNTGFASLRAEMSSEFNAGLATLRAEMSSELNTSLAALRDEMSAGFTRMERYFELSQAQYVELRTSLHVRIDDLSQRVDELSRRVDHLSLRVHELELEVGALRSELRSLRDWATTQVGELRTAAKKRHQLAESRLHELQQDVARLAARVSRLEE